MAELSPDNLKKFLNRLDPDPERAGKEYNTLLDILVKFLAWRGCPAMDAETLADEVINRVAQKLEQGEVIENPRNYCRGVAVYVLREYQRKRPATSELDDRLVPSVSMPLPEVGAERMQCLARCLKEFPDPDDRQLIIDYLLNQKEEKNKVLRKKLAAARGLTMGALRVKVHRLRDRLEKCVKKCVEAAG